MLPQNPHVKTTSQDESDPDRRRSLYFHSREEASVPLVLPGQYSTLSSLPNQLHPMLQPPAYQTQVPFSSPYTSSVSLAPLNNLHAGLQIAQEQQALESFKQREEAYAFMGTQLQPPIGAFGLPPQEIPRVDYLAFNQQPSLSTLQPFVPRQPWTAPPPLGHFQSALVPPSALLPPTSHQLLPPYLGTYARSLPPENRVSYARPGVTELEDARARQVTGLQPQQQQKPPKQRRARILNPFPVRLHRLLLEMEVQGKQDIVSFTSSGRAFRIHKETEFIQAIVPRYFKQSKLASFARQLHTYGFVRVHSGTDKGAYHHPNFQRDNPELAKNILAKPAFNNR